MKYGAHRVYRGDTRFLVRETLAGGEWYLCWRDGIRPPRGVLGTVLNVKHVERLGE